MTLPSPAVLTALAAAFAVGAGLIVWLMKDMQLALYMGLTSAALFLAAGVAHTYKQQGVDDANAVSAPVIAKLNASVASMTEVLDAQRDYATKLRAEQLAISTAAEKKAKKDHDSTVKQYESLLTRARADAAAHAIAVPGKSAGVLDDAIGAANTPYFGGLAAEPGQAAATVAADTTAGDLIDWGVQCSALYKDAVDQINGLQALWNDTRAKQLQLQPKEKTP